MPNDYPSPNKVVSNANTEDIDNASLPRKFTEYDYIKAATSDNTRKAYRSAIRQFEKWGGRLPCDEAALIRYVVDSVERLNPRTIDLHLAAIKQWHLTQGFTDPSSAPTIKKTMDGVRRTHSKPKQKAKALRLEDIAQALSYLRDLPSSKKQARDIALLLVGFFGAFRRSELVSLKIQDLSWEPEGLIITLNRSKTDQYADGIYRVLPYGNMSACPVLAIKDWLAKAGIKEGHLFRAVNRWDQVQNKSLNPASINHILKQLGKKCQLGFIDNLSSHSFRRGLSTSAAREKIDFELIKKQGGWKSDAVVWDYIDEGIQFQDNATTVLMEKVSSLLNSVKD